MLQEINHFARRKEYWEDWFQRTDNECNYNNVVPNVLQTLIIADSLKHMSYNQIFDVLNIDKIMDDLRFADNTLRIYQSLLNIPEVRKREFENKSFKESIDLLTETQYLNYDGGVSEMHVWALAEKYLPQSL